MWICLNNAFLSIVTPGNDPESPVLLVRARRQGDIERVFPNAKVEKTSHRDYLYRALINRNNVAVALADAARGIDYHNFKDSVFDTKLHNAYAKVWGVMAGLQETPPYSGA